MPEEKRPLKIFLCHASADKPAVRELYLRLTKDGVDAWLDKEKLLPGQDWEYEIRKAVRESDVVVVCLSKQFNQAGFRQKEVRIALNEADMKPEGEIFIIPARLEECDNLESLRKWHWVDLFEKDGYERLVRALRARADKIGAFIKLPSLKTPPKLNPTNPANPIVIPSIESKLGDQATTSSKSKPIKIKTEILVAIIGAIATIIVGILSSPLIEKWLSPAPASTASATATMTLTSQPVPASETPEPRQTATEISSQPQTTVLPITTLDIGTTIISDKDDMTMVYVPAGEFTMGSNKGTAEEKPAHMVSLHAFWIDQTEITVKMYSVCVSAGICKDRSSYIQSDYLSNHKFDNYPMIDVSWEDAITYCKWAERRLPTEAEWEKAARGENDFIYPWGNDFDGSRVNFCDKNCSIGTPNESFDDGFAETAPVGNYSNGASPYGALDMAGNVSEWVADWYSETYYANSPSTNPLGPDSGRYHVTRGGSWATIDFGIRSSYRGWDTPIGINLNVGFRCARDANP